MNAECELFDWMNDIDEKCDRNLLCDVRKKQKRRINIKSSNVFQHLQLSRKKNISFFLYSIKYVIW